MYGATPLYERSSLDGLESDIRIVSQTWFKHDRHESIENFVCALPLARGGSAYAVPVSHHYDEGVIHFRLADDGRSEKLAAAETTAEATFVCYGTEEGETWSIVASGPLRRTGVVAPETSNEWFGPLHVFDEAIEDIVLVGFDLQIERLTGRRTAT